MTEQRRPSLGPWRSYDTDEGEWVVDIPNDGEITVTRLFFGDMETNTGRDISNADLVAAAPDLLVACRWAEEYLDPPRGTHAAAIDGIELLIRVRAAIAKATGGETA